MGSNGLQCILTNFGATQYRLILSQVYFKLLLLQKPGNLHTEFWPTDQYIQHEHNTCSFSDKFLQWLFTFTGAISWGQVTETKLLGFIGLKLKLPNNGKGQLLYQHLHKSKSTCTNAHIHYRIELHFVTSCKKALYCEHCQNMECWNFQCCENCVQLNTICGACI